MVLGWRWGRYKLQKESGRFFEKKRKQEDTPFFKMVILNQNDLYPQGKTINVWNHSQLL